MRVEVTTDAGSERLAAAIAYAGDDPFAGVIAATRTPVAISNPRLPDDPIIFVNDAFCALTGYARDEVIGRNCRFLQGPDTEAAAVGRLRAGLDAGTPVEIDLLNYRKDGSTFWNRVAVAPVFDHDGVVTFFFASQSDVSHERAREQALVRDNVELTVELADASTARRESEERLRFATEAAAIGVWEVALPQLALTATPTINAVYGLHPSITPTVALIRAAAHPDDAARVFDIFDRQIAGHGEDVYFTSYRITRHDGGTGWIEARGQLVRDADGKPLRLIGVSQDVTARKEAEVRLQLNEESLRLATEAAEVGTWDLDVPNDILTWSDRTRAMFGISPGVPALMTDFYAGLHPDDLVATSAAFAAALDPDVCGYYDVEYRTVGKEDGIVRWIAARGRGLFVGETCIRAIGSVIDITARRRAAEQLALNEESLRLTADAGDVGIWDIDLRTGTRYWSDRTRAMYGLKPGAPIEMADLGSGIHPDDLTAVTTAFAAAIDPAVRAPYEVEYRTIGRKDGVVRWIAAKGKSLFDGDVCIRALGTVIDITERRRAADRQESLLQLSDELRALRDVQAIKTAAMTGIGKALGANRVCFGTVEANGTHMVVDTGYIDGCAPADGTCALVAFGTGLADEVSAGRTIVIADTAHDDRVDASHFAAIESAALLVVPLLRDGTHRASVFVASTTAGAWDRSDVALTEEIAARTWEAVERARAEARRADSEARLRAVIDAAPIGLVFAAADGAITGGNAQVEALLRHPVLPSPDVVHYAEYISFHDDGRQVAGHEYPLARALSGEERPELEVLYRRGDSTEAYLRFIAAPVRGRDGVIAGGVVATLDIDRERRAEMALRDLNATLERRVQERTDELAVAENALRQAQKMEAVGQLTGGIAHDFNNMLGIVLGSLDLLGRRLDADDVRARRYVDAATDGARRAATLTQRLLAFSRRQQLQPEPVDINRLVAGMSDLLRGSLGGGVLLETVLAGGLWPVCADPNQLENVVLNLAINARDAMDGDGKVTIETANAHLDDRYVEAEIGVAAGQYVLIAVTDAGTGMDPEVIAKAFDPFFTTKGVGKGTGLGLSQVYGFVKQSGGHVKIYSEVGVGTTVKLYLPRLIGDAPAVATATAGAAPVGGDLSELILVVEDDAGVRAVSVEALRELGYRVVEADGAAAALVLIEAHPDIALLFTDIVMPEVNGAKLAEAARARRPGLKVLFTTGYTRNAVVHNGVVDAGVELIGKPFTIDALAAKVRAVLDA